MKFSLLIILIAIYSCSTPSECNCPDNPLIDYNTEVLVERVIDGDTFTIMVQDDEFSIRVLGIDCFETKHNDRLKDQAEKAGISEDSAYSLGQIAKKLADSLLSGNKVIIKRDEDEDNFDTYNRLLRWVIINNLKLDSIMLTRNLALKLD